MPAVEIYTKTFCPIAGGRRRCSSRRAWHSRKFRSISAGAEKEKMIQRARGPHDGSADLHRRNPCRRLRRADGARARRQARRADRDRMTRIALFQSTTGIDPDANARALMDAVEQAAAGGAEMLFTPEMSGLLDRDSARAAKRVAAEDEDWCSPLRESRSPAPDLAAHRLARRAGR